MPVCYLSGQRTLDRGITSVEERNFFIGGLEISDGYASLPSGPELGIRLNEKVAAAHPYDEVLQRRAGVDTSVADWAYTTTRGSQLPGQCQNPRRLKDTRQHFFTASVTVQVFRGE